MLTTHFLDEADTLGDRIAILHKGRLQCIGSSVTLKRQAGHSFHLTLGRTQGAGGGDDALLKLVQGHVAGASVESLTNAEELAIALPQKAAPQFAGLFTTLDATSKELGVTSYGLSIPTLQEVFIQITQDADAAEIAREEEKKRRGDDGAATARAPPPAAAPAAAPPSRRHRRSSSQRHRWPSRRRRRRRAPTTTGTCPR